LGGFELIPRQVFMWRRGQACNETEHGRAVATATAATGVAVCCLDGGQARGIELIYVRANALAFTRS
jgi:hypothetical protein